MKVEAILKSKCFFSNERANVRFDLKIMFCGSESNSYVDMSIPAEVANKLVIGNRWMFNGVPCSMEGHLIEEYS